MKEAAVKLIIKKVLDAFGDRVYWFMPPGVGYGRAGIPDFVFCIDGKFCAIEAKGEGGAPTALQLRELERIRQAGGRATIIDDTGGAAEIRLRTINFLQEATQ